MNNLPLIEVCEKRTLLCGKLCFTDYSYLEDQKDIKLSGCYEIEMRISENYIPNDVPHVWETGGYLPSLAKSKEINLWDMHVYYEKEESESIQICLGIPWAIRKEKSVESIFKNLIIPYFWFYAYYEKYDEKPWGDLKHDVGFLQDYVHNQDVDIVSYVESMPNNEIFRKVVGQHDILDNDPCLCRKQKIPCDCGGVEGFRLLQERFQGIREKTQGLAPKKIHGNDPCLCGDMKAKKCTCGKMEIWYKERETHSNYQCRIKACQSKAKKQNESKESLAKYAPR